MREQSARRLSGFTLVELMVTLSVVAILLVAAAPSFADFVEKSRLKGVADGVVDLINNARAESVRQGRDVSVALGGTTTAWCVGANVAKEPGTPGDPIPAAAACDCTTPATCVVSAKRSVFETSQNNGVELASAPTASFTFNSRFGTVSGLGTTAFTMTSPKKKFDLRLTVTPLGQVTLCVPATSDRPIAGYPSC